MGVIASATGTVIAIAISVICCLIYINNNWLTKLGLPIPKTLDELNALGSLEEAMDYVADNFEWDSDSTAVQLFENVLKRRFA